MNLCYMCQAEKEQKSSAEGLLVPGHLLTVQSEDEYVCLGRGINEFNNVICPGDS